MLVAVMFMMAILVLSMAVAIPRIKADIQRDRDLETMHRGKQYMRAIQLYYRKFNAYPPNVDALVKTNEIRFLRKKYVDPTTGKDEWKPVLFGQNKAPMVMGFFGQAMPGSTMAGIGPAGGNGLNGVNGPNGGNGNSTFGNNSNSTFGNSSNSTFGNSSNSTFGNSNTTFGNSSNSTFGNNSTTNPGGPSGTNGTSSNGTSSGTDPNASAFGGPGNSTGGSGQTFGGAGIVGFSPGSRKQSILIYKKKDHYNEWEFTYDPASERMTISGNTGGIGTPASSTTTPVGGAQPGGPGTTGTTVPPSPGPPPQPQQ